MDIEKGLENEFTPAVWTFRQKKNHSLPERKKTYAQYLVEELSNKEIADVKEILLKELTGKIVEWKSNWLFVKAVRQQWQT